VFALRDGQRHHVARLSATMAVVLPR